MLVVDTSVSSVDTSVSSSANLLEWKLSGVEAGVAVEGDKKAGATEAHQGCE